MVVYFDNSATTQMYDEVIGLLAESMKNIYGNPSGLHKFGIIAENELNKSRVALSEKIKCDVKEICFTSGGTEGNNLAVIGAARRRRNRGNRIITSEIEHASVLECFSYLKNEGFDVRTVRTLKNGVIDVEEMESYINDDTILVSIMHVNNETGVIQPVDLASKLIRKKSKNAYFHVDAIQSLGKLDIDVCKIGCDLLTLSGHKVHGPKGVGALYIKKGTLISPSTYGGGQENGVRNGTENVHGVMGFGRAVCLSDVKKDSEYIAKIRDFFEMCIKDNVSDIHINGGAAVRAPHISNVAFYGVKAEVLLHSLESRGIYVSSGASCSSRKNTKIHVLTSMWLAREAECSLRFSFSAMNNIEEVKYAVSVLKEEIEKIRK